jgi:hypothetical protein
MFMCHNCSRSRAAPSVAGPAAGSPVSTSSHQHIAVALGVLDALASVLVELTETTHEAREVLGLAIDLLEQVE